MYFLHEKLVMLPMTCTVESHISRVSNSFLKIALYQSMAEKINSPVEASKSRKALLIAYSLPGTTEKLNLT